MEILIESGEDLYSWFHAVNLDINRSRACETLAKDVHVGVKVRKEVMTSIEQSKIVLCGRVYKIEFDNLGGGVYRASFKINRN